MDLEGFDDYIVFYTSVNMVNTMQHLIGFEKKPDIVDVHDALIEWETEVAPAMDLVAPAMDLSVPVYMIFMNRQGIMDLFGMGG